MAGRGGDTAARVIHDFTAQASPSAFMPEEVDHPHEEKVLIEKLYRMTGPASIARHIIASR